MNKSANTKLKAKLYTVAVLSLVWALLIIVSDSRTGLILVAVTLITPVWVFFAWIVYCIILEYLDR
jgi:hypothetical protein